MTRVTAEEVTTILDTSLDEATITEYIEATSIVVNEWFKGVSISDDLLKEIERWMVAHNIAATRERMAREEGAGGAYIKYTGYMYGTGLKSTPYGQMAIQIDTTKTLTGIAGNIMKIRVVKQ